MSGFESARLARLQGVLAGYVERGDVVGLAWGVARRGDVDVGSAGAIDEHRPVGRDTIFRISSMSKPITAATAMILAEECLIRLDEPVDRLLPELAHRRVLARPDGALDDTVPAFVTDPGSGERREYDPAAGQWSTPPAFQGGGAGLVSTVDDYLAFATMLRAGGTAGGRRILSRPSIELMTKNHLTAEQMATSGPDPDGALGWGFGVGVHVRRAGLRCVGSYGWDGGLGSSWANDPREDLTAVLLTNQMWSSPQPPPVSQDFWASVYAAIDD